MQIVRYHETTVSDRDSGLSAHFLSIPERSTRVTVEPVYRILDESPPARGEPMDVESLGLQVAVPFSSASAFVAGLVAVFESEGLDQAVDLAIRLQASEQSTSNADEGGAAAFAHVLVDRAVLPFEGSPLHNQSLRGLIEKSGGSFTGGLGGVVGSHGHSVPVVILSVAAGIIVGGSASGIGDALRIGLRYHLLRLMRVPPARQLPGASDQVDQP